MRIEVGYGLEGTLTDGIAGSILRTSLAPRFKAGDYDRGIEDGVGAILAVLEGRGYAGAPAAPTGAPAEAPADTGAASTPSTRPDMPWYQRVLLGAFIFGIIGLFTVIGVVTPGAGLVPLLLPDPVLGDVPDRRGRRERAPSRCSMTYLVAFPIAKLSIRKKAWYLKAAQDLKSKGSATVGGMVITSGGGGSSSSSGGGGGFPAGAAAPAGAGSSGAGAGAPRSWCGLPRLLAQGWKRWTSALVTWTV